MANFTPMQTGFSRLFVIERGAQPDRQPEFLACMIAEGINKSFGDETKIECPDPTRPDAFVEVGTVSGSDERMTTSLTGRFAADLASRLLELAKQRCRHDFQVHVGPCEDLSHFNEFTKDIIYEGSKLTTYGTDALGALASGDRSPVNESGDISVKDFYEVLQLTFERQADDIITNELVDGVICDRVSCGGCDDESGGCEKIYFVTAAAGGSPGTPADIVFSIDKGGHWYAHDIDTLGAAEDPTGVACLGIYVVVVSNDSCSLHYATKSEILPTHDEAWTEQATGFVAGNCPNDIWSVGTYAFIVGDNGYVYGTGDPTAGVEVLDAGVATSLDLLAVHALNDQFAVAVGNSGVIVKTENQITWTEVVPTNALFVQRWRAVWVKNEKEWWIAGSLAGVGQVWYTLDGGQTFHQMTRIPGTYLDFYDIQFATASVAYLSGTITGPRGRILRTFNGGYDWVVLPEGSTILPLNDRITAIATCGDDVNFIAGGGLADNGTDGILVVGQD